MIANIRLLSHQLANPEFENPRDLVEWMGAIQGQSYSMAKWAIGIRLKSATIQTVEKALERGEILRTHVMRPTWHLVAAEDIRWMLKLSAQRVRSAFASWSRDFEITESQYTQSNGLIGKMLEGNKNLTKEEIESELGRAGITTDKSRVNCFLLRAEVEGIVCSGIDNGTKQTYALLEERAPAVKELHKEEALARLALRYFRSHSPASLQDFTWWSGLSVTEAKHAVGLISSELITDKFESHNLLVHESCNGKIVSDGILHFLPAYDEYLISYKDRTAVLDVNHYPKAFTNYGIFYPVIMYNGQIVGNWKKSSKKGQAVVETSFFDARVNVSHELIEMAGERFRAFMDQHR